MTRVFHLSVLLSSVLLASFAIFFAISVSAQQPTDAVLYPIDALGGCESRESCRLYCDNLDNASACLVYAEEHGLLPPDSLERGRAAVSATDRPGGCTTKSECRAYCAIAAHFEECISFSDKHGLLPDQASDRAKRVIAALKEGERLPGGCTTKEECATFCADRANIRQCLSFSERAGLLSSDELSEKEKIIAQMERGEAPGGCTSREACRRYCAVAERREECAAFAERLGLITPVESAHIRSGIFEGPGGCASREECATFCNLEANHRLCIQFALDRQLLDRRELGDLQDSAQKIVRDLPNAPPQTATCVYGSIDAALLERIENGRAIPSRDIANRIRQCFERATAPAMTTDRATMPPSRDFVDCRARAEQALADGTITRDELSGAVERCRNSNTTDSSARASGGADALRPGSIDNDCAVKVRRAVESGEISREQADEAIKRCQNAEMAPLPKVADPVAECVERIRRAVENGTIRPENATEAIARCKTQFSNPEVLPEPNAPTNTDRPDASAVIVPTSSSAPTPPTAGVGDDSVARVERCIENVKGAYAKGSIPIMTAELEIYRCKTAIGSSEYIDHPKSGQESGAEVQTHERAVEFSEFMYRGSSNGFMNLGAAILSFLGIVR